MKIVIAPDSFKESLSAQEVAEAIKKGFERIIPDADYHCLPIGDGGEGTVDALISSLKLKIAHYRVTGPFGQPISARYAYSDSLAIFEMADIVGLASIPLDKRNPLNLTTKGVGELIRHLIEIGFEEIMVGVGGSATNDAGIGMAAGLGYEFYDKNDQPLEAIGANLSKIMRVDETNVINLNNTKITIITDVSNPLYGPQGATYIFAGQKGLEESLFEKVDQDIKQFYQVLNPQMLNLSGAGAGGGMAAGLVQFAKGKISSGINHILDSVHYDQVVKDADLVIVGEGRMDRQSLNGKAPVGIARRTPAGIPVLAICGSLADDLPPFPNDDGIIAAFPIIAKVDTLEHVLENASTNLERTASHLASLIRTFKKC